MVVACVRARMCAHVVCGGCEDAVQLCMGERRGSGDAASGAALALGGGGGGVQANDVRAHSHACAVEAGGFVRPARPRRHEQGEQEAERLKRERLKERGELKETLREGERQKYH